MGGSVNWSGNVEGCRCLGGTGDGGGGGVKGVMFQSGHGGGD